MRPKMSSSYPGEKLRVDELARAVPTFLLYLRQLDNIPSSFVPLTLFVRTKSSSSAAKDGRATRPCRRRQRRAVRRAPAAAAHRAVQRRPAAVDEEQPQQQGRDYGAGARGGGRGGGGQHVPHRRRRGRGARRHRLPHLLLPQGHVPRVRRRRVRPQVRLHAARQRGEEGPAADRLRQLQRPRQARSGRQVE